MTDIMDTRQAAYDHICKVYDDYLAPSNLACQKGCAACCTINVTLTSLEACRIARYIDQQLSPTGQQDLFDRLRGVADRTRFQPRLTLNRMAALYQQDEDVPDEEINPDWGVCPLLTDDACPIYDVRPFACRCLVSEADCRKNAYASIDNLTVTVSQVMQQYIEHIDAGGFTGNLVDMLLYMAADENRRAYQENAVSAAATGVMAGPPPGNWAAHSPATVLLAGPEEKEALSPILAALNAGGY